MSLGVKRGTVLFSFKGLQGNLCRQYHCSIQKERSSPLLLLYMNQGRLLFVYFTHNIAAGAHDMALY